MFGSCGSVGKFGSFRVTAGKYGSIGKFSSIGRFGSVGMMVGYKTSARTTKTNNSKPDDDVRRT
jgi:hypothetical protein